jgi:hypothetical protein
MAPHRETWSGRSIRLRAHAVLLVDQAGWHMSTQPRRAAQHHIIALPPKSPELNSVENISVSRSIPSPAPSAPR